MKKWQIGEHSLIRADVFRRHKTNLVRENLQRECCKSQRELNLNAFKCASNFNTILGHETVSYNFTTEQKANRRDVFLDLLVRRVREPELMSLVILGDESWIFASQSQVLPRKSKLLEVFYFREDCLYGIYHPEQPSIKHFIGNSLKNWGKRWRVWPGIPWQRSTSHCSLHLRITVVPLDFSLCDLFSFPRIKITLHCVHNIQKRVTDELKPILALPRSLEITPPSPCSCPGELFWGGRLW